MLPGIGDYREPYDEYKGYLWDEYYGEDDEEYTEPCEWDLWDDEDMM